MELTLSQYFMKYSERKISQCILPFNDSFISLKIRDNINIIPELTEIITVFPLISTPGAY